MKDVYFSKDLDKIIKLILRREFKMPIGIKVHFGEKGCTTYLNPKIAERVYNAVKEKGATNLIECNVLYKGSRTTTEQHLETAKSHGFTFAPIDICDSEGEIVIKGRNTKELHIGKNLQKYNTLIVVSHVKGHGNVGFGGAIKNVGMGLASRQGKLAIHAETRLVVGDECKGCGKCVLDCPESAITLYNKKARISEKCIGCAHCVSVCPNNAILIPWSGAHKRTQEKIADYCQGILKNRRVFFINVLENITPECDCYGAEQKPAIGDIGYLFSEDIVSIDRASYNLINQTAGMNLFKKFHDIDVKHQFFYAKKIGIGDIRYRLINLDSKEKQENE